MCFHMMTAVLYSDVLITASNNVLETEADKSQKIMACIDLAKTF